MKCLPILLILASTVLMASPQPANMPNQAYTPGIINLAVTSQNVAQTICKIGWTKTIRPPASYTTRLKIQQLRSGPYQSDLSPSAFEEDHLISLELGGHPTDPRNLWPEHYSTPYGARQKDQVENKLHRDVCAGRMTLADAQRLIAHNWIAVYDGMKKGTK